MTEADHKDSVVGYVADWLNERFHAEYDWSKIKEPELEKFHKDGALFNHVLRSEVEIPRIPGIDGMEPSLLLYNLGRDEDVKGKDSYMYLDQRKQRGPGALYGTSGAGKTRSILEYLSYNKGVYLTAQSQLNSMEPGSTDLSNVFLNAGMEVLAKYTRGDDQKGISKSNKNIVESRLVALLYVRHAVHQFIQDHLKAKFSATLSAKDWLLLQLYPSHYFGDDIFWLLTTECIANVDVRTTAPQAMVAMQKNGECFESIVVDESQMLLKSHKEYFLSDDGDNKRSGFSAVLSAFLNIKTGVFKDMPYPVFSGTGMSIDEIGFETASAVGKRLNLEETIFALFLPLDMEGVKTYMRLFLQLDNVDEAVVDHTARWLRGRPRWTATFLEEFLVRPSKPKSLSTNGRFQEKDEFLVQALDRYIAAMTTKHPRESWTNHNTTAYTAVEKAMLISGKRDLQSDLENAIYFGAIGDVFEFIRGDSKELIEIGVARLKVDKSNQSQNAYTVIIDEPLIVEAGIQCIGLRQVIETFMKKRKHSNGLAES